jgi:small GTP-binding protein
MTKEHQFDVFLSYASEDVAVVRAMAERLRSDGLRVWFDEWETQPGTTPEGALENGLEQSHALVFCMSANAFGAEWARLESSTFRFRDPLNRGRRFVPVRLDNSPAKRSLANIPHIDWTTRDNQSEYLKLLDACRARSPAAASEQTITKRKIGAGGFGTAVPWVSVSANGQLGISAGNSHVIHVWDLATRHRKTFLEGHTDVIHGIAMSPDGQVAVSCSKDGTIKLWDVANARCLHSVEHPSLRVAISGNGKLAASGGGKDYNALWLWNTTTGESVGQMETLSSRVTCIAMSFDGSLVVSGYVDASIVVWNTATMAPLATLTGHTAKVMDIAISDDGRRAVSCSRDKTVRLWDLVALKQIGILEGHTKTVRGVAITPDGSRAASGGDDGTIRVWDLELSDPSTAHRTIAQKLAGMALTADGRRALSGAFTHYVTLWDLPTIQRDAAGPERSTQYTNAKVLLVGESGAGKTGLSRRLTMNQWQPSDSTVGAWATQWKLPVSSTADDIEREIWLWDFGGQADQRLVHQLYMDDTALAVLVFDGQKDDLFDTLGQWDRDLTRASRTAFTKLLVAGRVDAGGLRISRSQIDTFVRERGFLGFFETSAKHDVGCGDLKAAIVAGIRWAEIPWRSSPHLFRRLKDEILRLKDGGRALMRFNELRDALRLQLTGDDAAFKDEELKAAVSLLAGPGVVWELRFGSWILLQPERINAYAQAVIQTLRGDELERGCIPEQRVLEGDLMYQSSLARLESEEERFALLAMHQTLVERGLCLREHTETGPLLIFPTFYRRERSEIVRHPAVLVSYRFRGFLDDIYTTLVVRLHHTKPFRQDGLWRYAADFRTLTGKQLGVKLTRIAEGAGELEVYFDPAIPLEEKIIFSRYVHEHLLKKGQDVVRLRHYVCPHCVTPVGNREVAMKRLGEGKKDIVCVSCENRVVLWDEMEELFASNTMKRLVQELEEQSAIVLDNESKERALVGEVISTVALAGQICREFNVSDHGIDMEVEFKNDDNEATGQKLYLQLKSGDSYLRERKSDETEIFSIRDERHGRYWMAQRFPVLLVIRTSDGEVRWMEVRDYLKEESDSGRREVRQVVFRGERFDVMSVRRWRERALAESPDIRRGSTTAPSLMSR